jgi:hypothetical protein
MVKHTQPLIHLPLFPLSLLCPWLSEKVETPKPSMVVVVVGEKKMKG